MFINPLINPLNPAQQFLIDGLINIETEMGSHTFIWSKDGKSYDCIASSTPFRRELETGGFSIDIMLTLTVRQYDSDGQAIFVNGIPKPQDKVTYEGTIYRINSVNTDTIGTGGRLRIIAYSPFKGV